MIALMSQRKKTRSGADPKQAALGDGNVATASSNVHRHWLLRCVLRVFDFRGYCLENRLAAETSPPAGCRCDFVGWCKTFKRRGLHRLSQQAKKKNRCPLRSVGAAGSGKRLVEPLWS